MNDLRELVAFLQAQLEEDKRQALEAAPSQDSRHWIVNSDEDVKLRDSNDWIAVGPYAGSVEAPAYHIARHDPARVLREIVAKRRIVDAYAAQVTEREKIGVLRDAEMAKGDELAPEVAELTGRGIAVNSWINHLEWVVRVMATAYADEPGYRQEWKP